MKPPITTAIVLAALMMTSCIHVDTAKPAKAADVVHLSPVSAKWSGPSLVIDEADLEVLMQRADTDREGLKALGVLPQSLDEEKFLDVVTVLRKWKDEGFVRFYSAYVAPAERSGIALKKESLEKICADVRTFLPTLTTALNFGVEESPADLSSLLAEACKKEPAQTAVESFIFSLGKAQVAVVRASHSAAQVERWLWEQRQGHQFSASIRILLDVARADRAPIQMAPRLYFAAANAAQVEFALNERTCNTDMSACRFTFDRVVAGGDDDEYKALVCRGDSIKLEVLIDGVVFKPTLPRKYMFHDCGADPGK